MTFKPSSLPKRDQLLNRPPTPYPFLPSSSASTSTTKAQDQTNYKEIVRASRIPKLKDAWWTTPETQAASKEPWCLIPKPQSTPESSEPPRATPYASRVVNRDPGITARGPSDCASVKADNGSLSAESDSSFSSSPSKDAFRRGAVVNGMSCKERYPQFITASPAKPRRDTRDDNRTAEFQARSSAPQPSSKTKLSSPTHHWKDKLVAIATAGAQQALEAALASAEAAIAEMRTLLALKDVIINDSLANSRRALELGKERDRMIDELILRNAELEAWREGVRYMAEEYLRRRGRA